MQKKKTKSEYFPNEHFGHAHKSLVSLILCGVYFFNFIAHTFSQSHCYRGWTVFFTAPNELEASRWSRRKKKDEENGVDTRHSSARRPGPLLWTVYFVDILLTLNKLAAQIKHHTFIKYIRNVVSCNRGWDSLRFFFSFFPFIFSGLEIGTLHAFTVYSLPHSHISIRRGKCRMKIITKWLVAKGEK